MKFRGSITQRLISLSTLRGDGHPSLRKTRFPAAGPALPDGIGYPQGFNERFHIFEMILLSRASWRNVKLCLWFSFGWLRGAKLCFWFSFGPNAVRPQPMVKLKNKKQSLRPSAQS
jgi:hypothetical protein